MKKITAYRETLRSLPDWEPYLRENSGLPGPRCNLELVHAAAEEASPQQIERWLEYTPERAPENTPDVFLIVCATVALGFQQACGHSEATDRLRILANDPRWRVREAVAMALQRLGDVNAGLLIEVIQTWKDGSLLEQRAAAAAICEPRLLREPQVAAFALDLLQAITQAMTVFPNRRSEEYRVLRKALGYCWSVAVVALPNQGKLQFASWLDCSDPDIRWILRENLKKNRLEKMEPGWVIEMKALLAGL